MENKRYSKQDIASWPEGHRRCTKCHVILSFDKFDKHKTCLFGINTVCKECRRPLSRAHRELVTRKQKMLYNAKRRANKSGVPFTLTPEDIVIPDVCPVFKVPFEESGEYVASLDQRNPGGGYTPDNIAVISWKANRLKNNATAAELQDIINWMNVTIKVEPVAMTLRGSGNTETIGGTI